MNDLDAINAAIASGDVAVPPIGAIVMLSERHPRRVGLVESSRMSKPFGGWSVTVAYGHPGLESEVGLKQIVQIIELPESSPPFCDWMRPGSSRP